MSRFTQQFSAISEVVNVGRGADKEVVSAARWPGPASDPTDARHRLDELSLSPLFIPVVRKLIREVDYETARHIAREVLQMATVQEIKGYLVERYRDLGLINWSRCIADPEGASARRSYWVVDGRY